MAETSCVPILRVGVLVDMSRDDSGGCILTARKTPTDSYLTTINRIVIPAAKKHRQGFFAGINRINSPDVTGELGLEI